MAQPRDLYLHYSPYLELFTGVRTALSINEGIIKLVGPDGAGKTSFCHQIETYLTDQGQDVIFFESPPESADYLFGVIQDVLGLDKNRNFNNSLTEYLLDKKAPDNKLYVIYDDAQDIDKEIFILIRLLNNIHNDAETLVSQIVCGNEQLDVRFDDPDLRSLTQYLNQSFTLSPMDRTELEDFCTGYLKMIDSSGRDFNSKELTEFFLMSKGLPGNTIALLDKALSAEAMVESEDESMSSPHAFDTESETETETDTETDTETKSDSDQAAETLSMEDTEISETISDTFSNTISDTTATSDDNGPISTFDLEIDEERGEVADEENTAALIEDEDELPVAASDQTDTRSKTAEEHMQEINRILGKDSDPGRGMKPTYFKIAISIMVVIVTMILASVLSGDNEAVNNQIARMVADDAPLYSDQVSENAPQISPVETTTTAVTEEVEIGNPTTLPDLETAINEEGINASVNETISETTDSFTEQQNSQSESLLSEQELSEPELSDLELSEQELSDLEPFEPELSEAELTEETETSLALSTTDVSVTEETALEEPTTEEPATEEQIDEAPGALNVVLAESISEWLDAWASGNINAYFAAYDQNFVPSYIESIELWEAQRRSRIAGNSGISTAFDRLELLQSSDTEATVRFWLNYSSDTYADETLKELTFHKEGTRWYILEERNIDVIRYR